MPTPLRQAIEAFKRAQREHAQDLHDPISAGALSRARARLDAEAAGVLRRLPVGVYPVTPECHYAVREPLETRDGLRHRGQTLCGAPSGYPPRGPRPAPCPACLLAAERYLIEGPPPLELDLGL